MFAATSGATAGFIQQCFRLRMPWGWVQINCIEREIARKDLCKWPLLDEPAVAPRPVVLVVPAGTIVTSGSFGVAMPLDMESR